MDRTAPMMVSSRSVVPGARASVQAGNVVNSAAVLRGVVSTAVPRVPLARLPRGAAPTPQPIFVKVLPEGFQLLICICLPSLSCRWRRKRMSTRE